MRVFIGLSYNRDHETAVCGVANNLDEARRLVELHRGEMLHVSPLSATDGPEGCGTLALEDSKNDLVGNVLIREVFTIVKPDAAPASVGLAKSLRDAATSPDQWDVRGLMNDAADLLDSSKNFLRRFLNPEDLGYAVTGYARDEVRAMLGMKKVEQATL